MENKKSRICLFLAVALLLVSNVTAQGLSVQIKRTNPGIAKEKSAELIFDVVNTDLEHKIEGFIWCRSPDDAVVSSTIGASSGSAQYVSPKFEMERGPSQKSIAITLDADTAGDKRTGCTIKYIPFKETVEEMTDTVMEDVIETITENVTVTEDNETKTIPIEKNITKQVEKEITKTKIIKSYILMNGDYIDTITDSQYLEIRLDKTVPFVDSSIKEPACPDDKASCSANEVIDIKKSFNIPIWALISTSIAIISLIVLVFRRSPSHY